MKTIRKLIGKYGPYDAFSLEHDWHLSRYLAIDQGPIPVMIENLQNAIAVDVISAKPGCTKRT